MPCSTHPCPRPSATRRLLRWLALALVLYAVVTLGFLYALQRPLIYRPDRLTSEQFSHLLRTGFGGRATVTGPLKTIVVEPPAGVPVRATAVFFHGTTGANVTRSSWAPIFGARGIRLVLAEYPGFGVLAGEPTESGILADARLVYADAQRRFSSAPILLVGESLGTGPAAILAAENANRPSAPSRLVLVTPFRNLPLTAARAYPYLPVRYLVKDVFDVESALKGYAGPLALLIAGQDDVVGAEQGQALLQRATAAHRMDVTAVQLPSAKHTHWHDLMRDADWNQLLGYSR